MVKAGVFCFLLILGIFSGVAGEMGSFLVPSFDPSLPDLGALTAEADRALLGSRVAMDSLASF
ncbi:MAG: hypothetical protein HYZ75_14180 [Elusimicrobia bacterium]|nr:hypothetical protein [Elusimicrobiota bacterium]